MSDATTRGDAFDQRLGRPCFAIFRDVRMVDPRLSLDRRGDILVRDGVVAEIGAPCSIDDDAAEVINGEGLHAFPAFVDPHVHLRVPGGEDAEDIGSGTRAAAAGGFCAVVAMPNTRVVVDVAPVLQSLRAQAAAEAHVATGFLAAITRAQAGNELTEMAELADVGALGFTDDGMPVWDPRVLQLACQYQRLADRVLVLHEEEPRLSRDAAIHEGYAAARLGVTGSPSIAESVMLARDLAIVRYEDARVHVQHISAAESVALIAEAKAAGVRVTTEVTPHHLVFTEKDVLALDTNFKMNPPLRSERDREALLAGLREGVIDCVATDHAPHTRESKEQPFEVAPMGVTGLETAFASLYTHLVETGAISLDMLVHRMTAGAEIYDVPAPSLAVGSPANLCLVDLGATWEVGEHGYESRSANSPFAGQRLKGRVRMTVSRGDIAYRERSFALALA